MYTYVRLYVHLQRVVFISCWVVKYKLGLNAAVVRKKKKKNILNVRITFMFTSTMPNVIYFFVTIIRCGRRWTRRLFSTKISMYILHKVFMNNSRTVSKKICTIASSNYDYVTNIPYLCVQSFWLFLDSYLLIEYHLLYILTISNVLYVLVWDSKKK